MTQVKCDNCEWTGDQCETEEIADFWSRVDVGGEVPAGDCPKCGAFAYLVKPATVPPAGLLDTLKQAEGALECLMPWEGDNDPFKRTYEKIRATIAEAEGQTVPPIVNHWEDNPEYPLSDWQYEVANGDTRLGYLDWAAHRAEAEADDQPQSIGDNTIQA